MRVGRKGVLLLPAMVLWAIMPALGCLTALAHRSCCDGMAMGGCSSAATMQCSDCCGVQPADAPLLPGSTCAVDPGVGSVAPPSAGALVVLPAADGAILSASETPLPPGSSGGGSILRI